MIKEIKANNDLLDQIIFEQLKPIIRKIDQESYYPEEFLKAVGDSGLLSSSNMQKEEVQFREFQLIENTARHCMTSAFVLWCHFGAMTSVRMGDNLFMKNELLPLLETGKVLGGTGLSNALKYYAGIEPISLKAERAKGGYTISGMLPSVSNLGHDHWFVILASFNQNQRIMGILPVNSEGLKLERKASFVGLNGSATYSCYFHKVFVPNKWIVSGVADQLISKIRPILALYQIPLGLGVSGASLQSILENYSKNIEINQYLNPNPDKLGKELQFIRDTAYKFVQSPDLTKIEKEILFARLKIAHLTSKVTHAEMLFNAGRAYMRDCDSFRRLRESYFLINLTPTIKQLEKLRFNDNK